MKNKKTLVAVLGILGIIIATVGVTYAFFSYSRTGTKENKIKSGAITFHYKEESRGISIGDVMPMTDIQGKAQSNYFDFTITSKTSDTVDIPYYITAIRSGTGTNMDGIVKVYLTKVDSQGNETEVALSKFSELGTYTNSDGINIPENEKLLYRTSVYAGDRNYNQKYRLRMWIDTNANFISKVTKYYCDNDEVELNSEEYTNCENEITTRLENVYPYEGKTYTIKVNVYGSGVEITQSQKELRENVDIEDVEIGNNVITSSTTTLTGTEIMPAGSTTMQKTITVNTVNPNSVVTIENLTPTASLVEKNNIKRLSSNHNIDLILGINTFKININSVTGRSHKEYALVITTVYPSYNVDLSGSNVTFESNNISVGYSSSNTVTVTPVNGYYLSGASCTNGYTTNIITGISAVSAQTVTVYNNGNDSTSICTFSVAAIPYAITYNLNGGMNPNDSKSSYTILDGNYSLPRPTKDYYTFDGWYDNVDLTGNAITQITTGSTGNKEYWAKWIGNSYSVSFDKQSGSGGTSSITANYNSSMPSIELPTRQCYYFEGYYDANGTQYYTSSGASAKAWDKTSATTLYAHWSINSTQYVSSSGSDSTGLGSYSSPFATISKAYSCPGDVTISLRTNITQNSQISFNSNKKVTLTSSGSRTLYRDSSLTSSALINLSKGTLTLTSITIDGQNITASKSLIYISSSTTLNLNSSSYVQYGKTNASYMSGGIYASSGTININGGIVRYNTSTWGGGIGVESGTLTMNSGSITNNTSSGLGGGLGLYSSTANLNGGSITSNSTPSSGGGVTLSQYSVCTINGTSISNNSANFGGGVSVLTSSTAYLKSGSISSNNATSNGSGFDVYQANLYIQGGNVTNNKCSASDGYGVFINDYQGASNTYSKTGGTISGNTPYNANK